MNSEIGNISGKPGAILAEERRKQNLSVGEVAAKLRISVRQIEALEADEYDKLPGVTFVRGFMRNYARFLQLDADALVRASGIDTTANPSLAPAGGVTNQGIRLAHEARRPGRGALAPLLLLAVLGTAGWLGWHFWTNRAPVAPQAAVPTTTPAQPGGAISIPVAIPGAGQSAAMPATSAPAASATTPAPMPVPIAPAPAVASTAAAPAAPAALGVLRFEFSGAARLELRDKNDFVIHREQHKPNEITEIQVRPPVALVIGNPKNVKMQFNGRSIDLAAHTQASEARFTLSDPE